MPLVSSDLCLFFFSSRRRHTRYWRDWSSDVCSSDLWWQSRKYDAALPKDASDSVLRAVLAYHQAKGGFPKNFVEVEEAIWKHKKPPKIGRASCRERV